MKLTAEQDSYYGAYEYTDPDYEPLGNAPEESSGGWPAWTFLVILLSALAILAFGSALLTVIMEAGL